MTATMDDSESTSQERTLLQKTLKNVRALSRLKKEQNTTNGGTADTGVAPVESPVPSKEEKGWLRYVLVGAGVLGAFFLFRKTASAQTTPAKRTNNILTLETSMQLTTNFTLGEFLVSSEIPEIKQYKLSEFELANVKRVASVLQTIRDKFDTPIFINSGIRPQTLVAKSGPYAGLNLVQILKEKGFSPAAFSQHMDGSAADFTTVEREKLVEIYKYIRGLGDSLVTQVILYVKDGQPDFIHMGVISDAHNFTKLPRFLLAKVTTNAPDSISKYKTEYLTYSDSNLSTLLA
jgi:hypothetical protein